jgi:hypothetical protein
LQIAKIIKKTEAVIQQMSHLLRIEAAAVSSIFGFAPCFNTPRPIF